MRQRIRFLFVLLVIHIHCAQIKMWRVTSELTSSSEKEPNRGVSARVPQKQGFPPHIEWRLAKFSNISHHTSDLHSQVGPTLQSVLQCTLHDSVYTNCSARDLYGIPTTEFPIGIKFYDLSRNHISSLPSHAFSRYTMLRDLNLQQNKISRIDPLAFVGLSFLDSLDLYKNKLVMDEITQHRAFSDDVFAPLKSLKRLRLEDNNPEPNSSGLRYPHKALSRLTSLVDLSLDGFTHAVFDSGFAKLKHLRSLTLEGDIYGKCKLTGLKNETFRYLTNLEHLNINSCGLLGHLIEAGAFLPLKRLISLQIGHNEDINVQFFDRIFYGLQNSTTLRALYMQDVVNPHTVSVCLSSRYIKYFPQSVEYLNMKGNRLECIDRNVIDKIKNSMKEMDISKNSFVFGTYLMDLYKMEHLRSLYIDNKIKQVTELPNTYPSNPHLPALETDNCSPYARSERDTERKEFTLYLPPNLKLVKTRFTRITYIFSRLSIDSNNSLQELRMEGNCIPYLKGPIIGLNHLRTFHFSFNEVEEISDNFFETLSSLVFLNLSANSLGDFFAVKHKTKVFLPLVNLQYLDLASNTIRVLGHRVFHGMNELKYLRISHNPIFRFHSDLSKMTKLQYLMAVDTSLSFLSKKTRDIISQRMEIGSKFIVELQQSPILCDCQNLAFLKWMVSSKAFNFKSKKYRCHYPDTSSIEIHDGYANVLYELSLECTSHLSLFFAVGAGTIGFSIFLVCSLAYRYRWKFRYMYHAAYIYLTSSEETRSANTFDYDVFLCYAEEDRHFVMDMLCPALEARGLSVFLHHRHFTAGELIGSNIVRAVNTCRRTVVVLTRTLAGSSWCNYEIQMANMETAQRGKPVLIFLLIDGLKCSEMGNELLYNVQNNTFIPFPSQSCRNEAVLNVLFDKLARDIRD